LIRSETAHDFSLPAGVRAVRILYHSRSASGKDVAASGVVLLPPGSPPKGGWPVIAWAHGTSGVAQMCAPSLMKDVYYGDEGLFPMVKGGFAVVATDYAGLGTRGPHQYIDRRAQANDVIYSVEAAHEAVPDLSKGWVVDGHSQGGGAAWGVAEDEANLKDPNYLGAVSVAGTVNPHWFMLFNSMNQDESFYTVYAAYAVKARFPQFKVAEMLTPKALAHYKALTTEGCWYYGAAVAKSGALGKVVKPGWTKNKWVHKFMVENETMKRPVAGPLFVLAGGADHSVPPESIRVAAEAACKKGYTIDFRVYPGLDHDPLMEKSTPDQLNWIRDRFAGKPPPDNCGSIKP
jgi:pimeloyl-ACP methyl ester carboxylesterase